MYHAITRQDGVRFFVNNTDIEFITATPETVKLCMKSGRVIRFLIDDDKTLKTHLASVIQNWLPNTEVTKTSPLWKIPEPSVHP